MSSEGSSASPGQQSKVTKHHVCGTNGVGDPRILVGDVEPGSVTLFGIDDDMTVLVLGNYRKDILTGEGKKNVPALLMYGCFNEPGTWGEGRVFEQTYGELDTVSILLEPGMF